MKKNIALLCDYGLDDAAATLYILKNADNFGQIDILPVGGNFPLEICFNNAKRILSNAEVLPDNIRLVDTSVIPQNSDFLPHIHGNDGIGDILPATENYKGEIISYAEWISNLDNTYTVVSLGPCTVTQDILEKAGPQSLLLMGGNIGEEPNHNEYEFNHGIDPAAFAKCAKHDHLVATLDTCHCGLCDFNKIELTDNGLFERTVKRAVQLSRERKEKGCYIYDLIAVVYLLHPEKFSSETQKDKFGNCLNVLKYIADTPII